MHTALPTRKMSLSALVALALVVLCVGVASAHSVTTIMPGDGSYASLSTAHNQVWVCDQQADGNLAYIRLWVNGVVQPPIYDADGYGGGCTLHLISPTATDSFNICVQNEGCGTPIYRAQF